ncbi:MAG: hypothetical protein AAGC43_01625 [Bacteroidota bacterium]
MEKFEKHIKEKLEAREIAPSSSAWEKIAGELSGMKRPKKKGKYGYAVAAAFIGLLIAFGIHFFISSPEEKVIPVVKRENPTMETKENKEVHDFKVEGTEAVVISNQTPVSTEIQTQSEEPIKMVKEVGKIEHFSRIPLKDSAIVISEDIIDKKANEVLNQVILLEDIANSEITDAEVDSLLRAAQQEIFSDKLFDKEGGVDAMALLTEVEDELDESFRDQIFEALKQGYLKVRTAVADRNN